MRIRYDWIRPGKVSCWDVRLRALRRAWNDADFWIMVADWICGPGLRLIIAIMWLLLLSAWWRLS